MFDFKLGRDTESSSVIIESPLVSLMVDQVTNLRSHGVRAGIMSGHKGVDKELLAKDEDVVAHTSHQIMVTK